METCCTNPVTGFYRDGCCKTDPMDFGTPMPADRFPELKPGDRWCLCATRWQEALEAGVAPPVILSATHEKAFVVRCSLLVVCYWLLVIGYWGGQSNNQSH